MKPFIFLSVFCLFVLSACDKDDSTPRSTASFIATIDGEIIQFQDPKVFIKREEGIPFSQEITAQVVADDFVERTIKFIYAGDLNNAGTDGNFSIIMGVYYENDYADSWRNTGGPGGIDLTLNGYPLQSASGTLSDFSAANGSDTLFISEISFENIPIRYADF
ncbi:MAG: hypothetical protein LC670_03675 [Flavobacteriales bacterium]|nr:hypothetical protein [Flavobacteriales bacterium]